MSKRLALLIFILALGALYLCKDGLATIIGLNRQDNYIARAAPRPTDWKSIGIEKHDPTHEELVWKGALEWCESRGRNSALNPNDKDNTPSYSNFQFKWDTLKVYVIKYNLLPGDLEQADYINWTYDYPLVTEIVDRMLGDKDVDFKREFPSCVRQLGYPPIN